MKMILICILFCLATAYEPHRVNGFSIDSSFAGLVEVNRTTGSNLFYWFFPHADPKAPIIFWFQGGPGGSGLIGLFKELGPLQLETPLDWSAPYTTPRTVGSWGEKFSTVFIDQPVGTGYSYTLKDEGYAKSTEGDVSRDMGIFFTKFFDMYNSYQSNDVYLTGESYAGHYIPAIATKLLEMKFSQLKGVAIGDELTDPAHQILTKPNAAFVFGLIDRNQRNELDIIAQNSSQLATAGRYADATDQRVLMESKIEKYSGNVNMYNIQYYGDYNFSDIDVWANNATTKSKLNVPLDVTYGTTNQVESYLWADKMRSLKHLFPNMFANLRVLLYQGQFDLKDGYSNNEAWIDDIDWPGRDAFVKAERKAWLGKGSLAPAAYVRSSGPVTEVLVRNAGHLTPMDQPEICQKMIECFVKGESIDTCPF